MNSMSSSDFLQLDRELDIKTEVTEDLAYSEGTM